MSDPEMQDAWNTYVSFVEAHAARIYYSVIHPWLAGNQYQFSAGNGDWYIKTHQGHILQPGELPENIYEILSEKIPGMPQNDLGSMMPSKRKEKKKNEGEEW